MSELYMDIWSGNNATFPLAIPFVEAVPAGALSSARNEEEALCTPGASLVSQR